MYEEQIKRLRDKAGAFDYDGRPDIACDYEQAADIIEELSVIVESYRHRMAYVPEPRGEDGEPGIKCIDCQRDCQMIGLDMPACTAYDPPKKK